MNIAITSGRTRLRALAALLFLSLTGAGCAQRVPYDEPSPTDSRRITSLSSTEQRGLCAWANAEHGPGREVDCGVDRPLLIVSEERCIRSFAELPPTCEVTVGYYATCQRAIGTEACSFFETPECTTPRPDCVTPRDR